MNLSARVSACALFLSLMDLAGVTCPSAALAGGSLRVSGLVLSQTGQPLPGVQLTFSGGLPAAVTGEAGAYSVAVPAAGEYTVVPSKPGFEFEPASRRVWVSEESAVADFRARAVAPKTARGPMPLPATRAAAALPDLRGSRCRATASAMPGTTITVEAQICNGGTAAARPFWVEWYLSRDHLASADDVLLSRPGSAVAYRGHAAIPAGAYGLVFTVVLQLPATWNARQSWVIMKTDSGGHVTEADESNNCGQGGVGSDRAPVTVGALPDLRGRALYAHYTTLFGWGDVLQVDASVGNEGDGPSGPFRVQWYLSRDAVGSSDDVLLPIANGGGAYYSHPGLREWFSGGDFCVPLQLPGRAPAGWTSENVYVVMKTDAAHQVVESNECNNFGQMGEYHDSLARTVATLTVDLQGARFPSEIRAQWGQTITLDVAVANVGRALSRSFCLRWYLSKDAIGSADDRLLALPDYAGDACRVGWVLGGSTTPFTRRVLLPEALPPGWSGSRFFVIMRADSENEVAETNERNNFGQMGVGKDRAPITLKAPAPDLRGGLLKTASAAQWGDTLRVGAARVANVGLQSAGPFRVRWYLSRDAAGSADDLLLHFTNGAGNTYNHPGIEASGEGAPFTATLQLPAAPPAGWGSGDLFVVMKTDASNHVAESDEINNFGQMGAGKDSCRVSVGADLRGASCSELRADRWGCKGFWGGALSMAGRIHNVGPGNAGASRVQWLLSRDSLGSEDDLPLSLADGSGDMLPVPSLPAGASHEVEAVVRLPATPPAGWTDAHSYVVMRSDAGGAVHETDELNNAGQMGDGKDSIRATVRVSGPDLYGAQCSAYYEPVLWGQSLNVVVRIGNAGDQPAGSFHVSWYLSKDRVGSGDDLLLTVSGGGTRYRHPGIGAGNPGLGRVFDIALGLPAEPPVGWTGTDFYVVMKTDADNEVAESREENNFGAAQQGPIYDSYLVKVGTRPELRGERLSNGWGPVVWGGEMHVFAQIANEGSLPSSPFQVQWFLSKDAVASADDLLLRQADGGTASYSHWGVDGSYSGEPCPAPSIGVRLALPATRPAGWVGTGFHLIMKTDAADQVAESNEGNNFGQVGEGKDWMAVTISDP